MLMDTDREREIGLGTRYKFDAMSEGQCLVSTDLAEMLELEENDLMYMSLSMF